MAATREEVLKADDRSKATIQRVPTPGWGDGHVFVRVISGEERDQFDASLTTKEGKPNMVNGRAKLAVLVVCDEQGERLFTDADAEALGKKCAPNLDRVFDIGGALNGLHKRDLDVLVKNSESGPSEDSGSSLPDAGAAPSGKRKSDATAANTASG